MDISEQKQLIEELKASEQRFKRLAETTFEGIVTHVNGEFVESNQQFCDMFGYSLEEIRGLNGYNLYAPEWREVVRHKVASSDKGPYEAICLRKDGSAFPVEIRARQIQLDGKVVRVAAIRDLSSQKAMEQKLLESENKYRQLYNNAQVALYRNRICDGKLIECNEAFAKLLGYDSRQQCLIECYAEKHMVDPQKRLEFVEELKKDGYLRNYQLEVTRRDGAHLWVEVTAKLNLEENYVEGAQFDITAAKVLTNAEKKVLLLLARGMGNKEAARILQRSTRTVEEHRSKIMQKLNVTNVVELAQKTQFLNIDIQKEPKKPEQKNK